MDVDFRGLTPLIQVFDMPASIRFYCDLLGFTVVTASGPVPNCGWALLRRNADEIMLNTQFEDENRPPAPDGARRAAHKDTCFYFGCDDLDAAYAHLQTNGVAARKPSTAPYGMRQLYFEDPDGFNLCFQHPSARRLLNNGGSGIERKLSDWCRLRVAPYGFLIVTRSLLAALATTSLCDSARQYHTPPVDGHALHMI